MTPTATQEQVDLDQVDLMDLKWFEDGPPHELFTRMRLQAPVRWNPVPDHEARGFEQDGFWSFTRHAEVSAISRDTDTFSSYEGGIFLHKDKVFPIDVTRNLLLYKDPPEHTKYRKILQTAFVPHTVAKREDLVRARVTQAIDSVIEQGECDIVQDIAIPITLKVLMDYMGLPEEDFEKVLDWSDRIEVGTRAVEPGQAIDALMEMSGYLFEQIERMKAQGDEESLVARLRAAEVDGEKLEDAEILVFFGLLLFAGNDTTRNTTTSGMLELLNHPDALAQMRDDRDSVDLGTEEILRHTSVVQYFNRMLTKDSELAGQEMKAGQRVIMWYGSASRDEEVYENSQTFDINRKEHSHKAFGGGGRHFCLGSGLARLELNVAFPEILRRMPNIELAGEVERLRSNWTNALERLPVTFTPGQKEG